MSSKPLREITPKRKGWLRHYLAGTWQLYAMMLIPIIYIICFKYKPMLGIAMAFKKYTPFGGRSMWEMDWVGFQWFQEAFKDSLFWKALANTLILNLGDLLSASRSPLSWPFSSMSCAPTRSARPRSYPCISPTSFPGLSSPESPPRSLPPAA